MKNRVLRWVLVIRAPSPVFVSSVFHCIPQRFFVVGTWGDQSRCWPSSCLFYFLAYISQLSRDEADTCFEVDAGRRWRRKRKLPFKQETRFLRELGWDVLDYRPYSKAENHPVVLKPHVSRRLHPAFLIFNSSEDSVTSFFLASRMHSDVWWLQMFE